MDSLHNCGGEIELDGKGDLKHWVCTRCSAFTFQIRADRLPDGISAVANRNAFNTGFLKSPGNYEYVPPTEMEKAHAVRYRAAHRHRISA